MSFRIQLLIGLALCAAAVLVSPVGDWLSARSDAAWWQVLPWALLVVFWAGIGLAMWRQRRTPSRRA